MQPEATPTELDPRAEGIGTVLWATGFLRRYEWLRAPVLDARGELRHSGGVTDSPGLYAIGLRLLRRRNSSFIEDRAEAITTALCYTMSVPER